ncbi:protein C19orf12 homolog [Coccinella septempunctata]|uniref:protein C19orf12 homolog n=1 Tax=Coccinella septempunctata TaxID=41139 RepID=UPI001D083DA5|nr:protein C19orf12 homolog [Coccinella septempunctata]
MPPSQDQIIDICTVLSEQEQLNVTVKEAGKGFLIAGTGAAVGTLLGGPAGLFIGGTIGSAVAAYNCRDKCKSVVDIIRYDMTPDQQRRLAENVKVALQSFTAEDLLIVLPMVINSDPIKAAVVKEIVRFLTSEMGMAVSYT